MSDTLCYIITLWKYYYADCRITLVYKTNHNVCVNISDIFRKNTIATENLVCY